MQKVKFETLTNSLQESIFTWEYFTNFNKAKTNLKKIEKELNLLNYLLGKNDIENEFISLVKEYPKIRLALPLLLAIRVEKLSITPIISDLTNLIPENKKYIFTDKLDDKIEKELLIFFNDSGLKDFFQNKMVKNLVDYCFGVEIGFDTNARKNRTGILMENIVKKYLEDFCTKNKNFSFIEQATQKRVKEFFNYKIEIDKNSRRFDFALFDSKNNKIYLIEVNYYSSGGSKLKATAGEYKDLHNFLKLQNITFVWITDGFGWQSAKSSLEETFNNNDYVININMLKDGILENICK